MSHSAASLPLGPTEEQFQQQIITLARLNNWRAYHTRDSRRSEPGFPDLVMVRRPRVLFAELKSAHGRLRPDQQRWLDLLRACQGVEVYIWRPSDWLKIVDVLTREDRCLT